jgi:hypothetical protein
MKLKSLILAGVAVVSLAAANWSASAATSTNAQLLSNLPLGAGAGDMWADGNHVYVARGGAGLDIVNVANPGSPVLVANVLPFAHARFSDVTVRDGIAYVSNELTNGSPTPWVGMFIYDVSNPANPVELSRLEWGMGGGYHLGVDAHSVFVQSTVSGPVVYLTSGITGDVTVFDVSNPAVPVYLSEITSPIWAYNSQAHDVVVVNDRAYTAWLGGGFTIHDVSNPAAPVLLGHKPTTSVNQHFLYHLWPTADGQHLVTTEENATGTDGVRIYDISNPGAITQVGAFNGPAGSLAHNLVVSGRYAYVSYLEDGLRILDIANPAAPYSVGRYDPDGTTLSLSFAGVFGVFPTATGAAFTHRTGGLYLVDFIDTITITFAEWNHRTGVLTVEAKSTAAPSSTLTVAGFGTMTYNVSTGRYKLTTTTSTRPYTVTLSSSIGGSASATVRRR